MTCVAFSISEPFRRPLWTNTPYLVSLIILVAFNAAMFFIPDDIPVTVFFDVLPFSKDGVSYYSYRYKIFAITMLNCLITYTAEKLIVTFVTRKADARQALKREKAYDIMMESISGTQAQFGTNQTTEQMADNSLR